MRRRFIFCVVLFLLAFVGRARDKGMYYVHFIDGRVWGYPKDFVKAFEEHADGRYSLVLKNDSVVSWPVGQVAVVDETAPVYPQFTSFKLDDKLNDQLFRDVEAAVTPDEVWASVDGIGKYLTPSFTMDIPSAVAYVDGKEQVSGLSRLRFAEEVVYTLGYPNYKRLSVEKVSEEIWSRPEGGIEEIPLTADMLSTNAPTSRTNEELAMMIDGKPSTIFHSTWSQDPIYSVDLSKQVYVSVELPKSLTEFQFYYQGRTDATKYNIYEWKIEASNDGEQWTHIVSIDEEDGLPTSGSGVSYMSPAIALGGSYRYLRFTAVRVGYKNYLCLSEFKLYEVYYEGEAEQAQPATYTYRMVPMGREVPVRIDWMTDYATSVPRIDIDVAGGKMVTSKESYLDAQITFQGNGVWDDYDFQSAVQIKGRGNSSWSTPTNNSDPKNPYRLKFAESVKPFGMKKGKNWNLIAQRQTGSLMTNPVAHKIARMVGMQTANDVIPVELYMNGEYRGSYYFTQKVGMANNSVDFDDESMAVLLELDSYYESGQFYSYSYGLPVNIKDPEFGEDETNLDYYGVQDDFNRFETAVYNNSNYERFVDMDMLVRYMLVNDLALNSELGHPKSTFLSRENLGHMTSRYTFGPAWDFDWAYGYEGTSSYCTSGATRDLFSYHLGKSGNSFYSDVLRSSDWVQYRYYRLWEEFIDKHLDELIDFVDDYYAYANSSFVNNSYRWGDGYNYDTNVANMKSWLMQRAHYIKDNLTPYAADEQEPFSYGDLNGDGAVNGVDMEYMLSCLFETPHGDLLSSQADADGNKNISLSDLTWISLLIEDERAYQVRSRRGAMLWDDEDESLIERYDFDIDDASTLLPPQAARGNKVSTREVSMSDGLKLAVRDSSGEWNVEVSLTNMTPYIAFLMDFTIPESFTLPEGAAAITLSYRTEGAFVATGSWVSDDVYRVIGYSLDNTAMTDAEGPFFTLSLEGTSLLAADTYVLNVQRACFVTENAFEEEIPGVSVGFEVTEEQASGVVASLQESLCWPADIYDAHGRLVRKGASSFEGLGKGVYIVNRWKYVR